MDQVERVVLVKPATEGGINNIAYVRMDLILKNECTVTLPDYLDIAVHEREVVEALAEKGLVLENRMEADSRC